MCEVRFLAFSSFNQPSSSALEGLVQPVDRQVNVTSEPVIPSGPEAENRYPLDVEGAPDEGALLILVNFHFVQRTALPAFLLIVPHSITLPWHTGGPA